MNDRRQFLLTNEKIEYSGFSLQSAGNYYLLLSPETQVQKGTDADGCEWFLLGDAFAVNQKTKSPAETLSAIHTKDVPAESFFWTGRWMLVGNDGVYTDATGLLALYRYEKDGKWFVTPSLHLLTELFPGEFGTVEKKALVHDVIHTFPAPLSRLPGVERLFPSQALALHGDRTEIVPQQKFKLEPNLPYEKKISLLASYIRTALSNAQVTTGKRLNLALTCGQDSRVLLAALLAEKLPFSAYTMQHGNIAKGDRQIPEKMSKRFGFSYRYIKKGKLDKSRLEEYDSQTLYSIQEDDRLFYANGQFDGFSGKDLILKGGILDFCRGSQYPASCKAPKDMVAHIKTLTPSDGIYETFNRGLDAWCAWAEQTPDGLEIRDRFAIEFHMGGWLANLQLGSDLCTPSMVQLCNSAAILSLILSFSEEERKSRKIYDALYKELYPAVTGFPINPKDRFHMIRYYWNVILLNPGVAFRKVFRRK